MFARPSGVGPARQSLARRADESGARMERAAGGGGRGEEGPERWALLPPLSAVLMVPVGLIAEVRARPKIAAVIARRRRRRRSRARRRRTEGSDGDAQKKRSLRNERIKGAAFLCL